jgi:putative transcriptional regulator
MKSLSDELPWLSCGKIRIKLKQLLEQRGITRFRLHTLTGIKYEIIDRYYKDQHIVRVDLALLSRICYVLECEIEDLMEYDQSSV